jgi:uncharacterized protein
MERQASGSAAVDPHHDEARSRYELRADGHVVAHAQYRREGERVVFTHTEVDSGHEGQGLASKLAKYALDDVRQRGLKAVPQCEFIERYIARHAQEYGDLLAQ